MMTPYQHEIETAMMAELLRWQKETAAQVEVLAENVRKLADEMEHIQQQLNALGED